MDDFKGKIAVVTGGGTGMGRELARQLSSDGCHVAICDVIAQNMDETKRLCEEAAPPKTRVTTHECDVSDETQVIAFRDAVSDRHDTEHINLLFNNAGIGHVTSFVTSDRRTWDQIFAIDWFGVYYNTRAFMPMLLKSTQGCIVNTSSVNGFWACLGENMPNSAYCAAKFAVKGFTESLQVDLRLNAPHLKAFLVMPGHIGTPIASNAVKILGFDKIDDIPTAELLEKATRLKSEFSRMGMELPIADMDDEQIRAGIRKYIDITKLYNDGFRDNAPLSPAQAATIILDGIRNQQWRILVGEDAKKFDQLARSHPEDIYTKGFVRGKLKK